MIFSLPTTLVVYTCEPQQFREFPVKRVSQDFDLLNHIVFEYTRVPIDYCLAKHPLKGERLNSTYQRNLYV